MFEWSFVRVGRKTYKREIKFCRFYFCLSPLIIGSFDCKYDSHVDLDIILQLFNVFYGSILRSRFWERMGCAVTFRMANLNLR